MAYVYEQEGRTIDERIQALGCNHIISEECMPAVRRAMQAAVDEERRRCIGIADRAGIHYAESGLYAESASAFSIGYRIRLGIP